MAARGSGNRKLSFVSFANGLDANANITVLQELGDYGANTSGTFNVATHEGTTWKFYVTTCGSDCSGIDPRGFNYCTPSHTYSSTFAGHTEKYGFQIVAQQIPTLIQSELFQKYR